jgi:hypothetical protein
MHGDTAGHRRDVLAIAIIVAAVSLFHARGLLPGQTFLPVDLANNNLPWLSGSPQPLQNWLISDSLYEFYPFLSNAVNTVERYGHWPLWNPYILLGQPVAGDPLATPFYPVYLGLGLVFGAARGFAIGLWLHAILAALLTYGFLRTIGCRRYAALIGAFTYALGGYMVTWFEATHRVTTMSWLPGVLWAFELAVRRRSLRWTALAAVAMGLAFLGGQFQFIVAFSLFLGLYAIGRSVESARHRESSFAWPCIVFIVTVGLGTLLAAIQLFPFAEYFGLSHRASSAGALPRLPPQNLITLVIPDFYGNPASIGAYWGQLNYSEGTIYAGVSALLLACVAPFWARRFFVTYLSLVTLAAVYFVVRGPGVQLLGSAPLVQYASLHRSAFILPLLIALLAAIALSEPKAPNVVAVAVGCVLAATAGLMLYLNWGQVQDHWQELLRPILHAALFLFFTIVILGLREHLPRYSSLAEWGLVLLVFLDLFLIGSRYSPAGPTAKLLPSTPEVDYLREHAGLQRVATYQVDRQVLFGPNLLSIFGIAEGGGYSSVVPERFRRLVTVGDPKAEAEGSGRWMRQNENIVFFNHPSRRLLDLLQVGYVVLPEPQFEPGVRAELLADGCEGDSGEISGNRIISGTFAVQDTAINRMDMRFRVYRPIQLGKMLTVRMWEGLDRARQVLAAQVDTASLSDQQTVTLFFAPENEAPGKTYVWEIAADQAEPDTGVGLCTLANGQPAVSVYGADWELGYQDGVSIYKRLAPHPRAYIVYAAEQIPEDERAVNRLLDETFDLRNVAVTADPTGLPAEAGIRASTAEITAYEDRRVVVRASAIEQGLLVLGDQYHPGWRAYLDSNPVDVLRVNHVLRGVLLPPGEHEVVFEFAPLSLRNGIWLSLVGLIIVGVMIAVDKHPRVVRWLGRAECAESSHEQ